MRVRDAAVVITGAGSGIGRASAVAFADAGASLVLAGRRSEALTELAHACEARGVTALPVSVDVTDPAAVDELARRAVERFGRIDVWINNAAVTMFAPVSTMSLADLHRVIDVDLLGYVHGARSALRQMRRQGGGVLINVGSVAGVAPQPYTAAYAMAKAGVRSLSGTLRQELQLDGHSGIKVCTVLAPSVDTPLFRQGANRTGREAVPMPPVYSPQRVARTIVGLVRWPRREVVAGGPLIRFLLLVHQLTPGLAERLRGWHVNRSHLSRQHPAAVSSGNLYQPSPDPHDADTSGGWGGRQRTAQRTLAAAGLGVAGLVVLRRMQRRTR